MVGVVLTGHGAFASGLASALDMVAGTYPHLKVVTFEESGAATYSIELLGAIHDLRAQTDGVLVLCDLLGGTPFNQAMMITQQVPDVEVVAGANLPMLVDVLLARSGDGATLGALVDRALRAGAAGVVHKVLRPNSDDDEIL